MARNFEVGRSAQEVCGCAGFFFFHDRVVECFCLFVYISTCGKPLLVKFQGRPKDFSPKARMYNFMGCVFLAGSPLTACTR